jgi:cation transport ATPase
MVSELTMSIGGMTCASCIGQIERALVSVPGVKKANVDLGRAEARVTYDSDEVEPAGLTAAVVAAGYEAREVTGPTARASGARDVQAGWPWLRPVAFGALGALALLGLYLGIISVAESPAHAWQQLRQDLWSVVPITLGFGVQAGLFSHLRLNVLRRPSAALPAAGGGTSTAAMVACCAHHVTDVLPFLGLSAAAVFLNQYRIWFMAAGIGMNLIGIAVMLKTIRKASTRSWAPALLSPAN